MNEAFALLAERWFRIRDLSRPLEKKVRKIVRRVLWEVSAHIYEPLSERRYYLVHKVLTNVL